MEAKGIRFQGDFVNEGKAGTFIGFEDRDGNQLYLAELDWSHVEEGEGELSACESSTPKSLGTSWEDRMITAAHI
jgi:hypothetical protein